MKIAVATRGDKGLEDSVSDEFGKTPFFTIVIVDNERIKEVRVVKNPGIEYRHGSGPIAVKALVDMKIDVAVASFFGTTVLDLLSDHKIRAVKVSVGKKVKDILRELRISFFS